MASFKQQFFAYIRRYRKNSIDVKYFAKNWQVSVLRLQAFFYQSVTPRSLLLSFFIIKGDWYNGVKYRNKAEKSNNKQR